MSICNQGFYEWEGDKFSRLQEVFSNEKMSRGELETLRKDFVIFVDEHDRRRGTDFLGTFPEMEGVYREWKNLI